MFTKSVLKAAFKKAGARVTDAGINKEDARKLIDAGYLKDMPDTDTMVSEMLTEAWEIVASNYNYDLDSQEAEEIEYKRRDGFIPHTQGGYEITGFSTEGMLIGTGKLPSNKKASEGIQKGYNQSMEMLAESFWEENEKALKDAGFSKLDFLANPHYSLSEAADKNTGLDNLLNAFEDGEADVSRDDYSTVMFRMGVYYHEPEYEGDDHTAYVFAEINWEAPYHRNIKDLYVVTYKKDLPFSTPEELKSKLQASLKEAADSL